MNKNPFNWKLFSGSKGGFLFEDLCLDLMKALGKDVQFDKRPMRLQSNAPGADNGRDILVLEAGGNGIPRPTCVIECKSRTSDSRPAISKTDLCGFVFYIMAGNVMRGLIFTNTQLNNPLLEFLINVNKNPLNPYEMQWLEKEDIESLIARYPDIYKKYWGEKLTPKDIKNLKDAGENHAQSISTFIRRQGNASYVEMIIRNATEEERTVTLRPTLETPARSMPPYISKVPPRSAIKVCIPVDKAVAAKDICAEWSCGIRQENVFAGLPLAVPIDLIFVDPFGWLKQIEQGFEKNARLVYLCGGAGSGKSRLALEFATGSQGNPVWCDLADDQAIGGLKDRLLMVLTELDSDGYSQLSKSGTKRYLETLGVNPETAKSAANYLNMSSPLPPDAVLDILSDLFISLVHERLLVIENIHRMGDFDGRLFHRLLEKGHQLRVLATGRDGEISEGVLSRALSLGSAEQWATHVDLGSGRKYDLLSSFADQACANDIETRKLLTPLLDAESVQQFIFSLKELRAQGILKQTIDGHFSISNQLENLSLRQYQDVWDLLLHSASEHITGISVKDVIQVAAIYGRSFPVEFVEYVCKADCDTVFDYMIKQEVLRPAAISTREGVWLEFDHELTHEIALKSVPPMRRTRVHKGAVRYISDEKRFRSGEDDGRLGYHQEHSSQFQDAAQSYYSHGMYLDRMGQPEDALVNCEASFKLLQQIPTGTNISLFQADVLNDSIRMQIEVGCPADELRLRISALRVHLMQFNALPPRYHGRLKLYEAKIQKKVASSYEAINLIQEAIDFFVAAEQTLDAAEAHIELSILHKNRREFLEATREIRKAIELVGRHPESPHRHILAMAYLDFGAIYLESHKLRNVPYWWSKAVDKLRGTTDIGKLSFALADRAYIYALVEPTGSSTEDYLIDASTMAKNHGLKKVLCRSLINYANWIYFFGGSNEQQEKIATSALEDARRIAQENGYTYMLALIAFSRLNFTRYANQWNRGENLDVIVSYIDVLNIGKPKAEAPGDQRILNMLLWLYENEPTKLEQIGINPSFIAEFQGLSGPYQRGEGEYATYY